MSSLEASSHAHEHGGEAVGETHETGAGSARNENEVHTHTHTHVDDDGVEHTHAHSHEDETAFNEHHHLHAHQDEGEKKEEEDDEKAKTENTEKVVRVVREDHPPEEEEEDVYKGPAERLVTPAEATEIGLDDEEIRYTGTSGLKVTRLEGLEQMKKLRVLVLRSCLIADMSNVAYNGPTLEHLELYDNQVKSLRGVEACPFLKVLDMSYNVIRSTKPVAVCKDVQEVYVAANKLRTIEGLDNLDHIVKLDLGANRIREISGLPKNVKHLFLGKNRIEKIDGLGHLKHLRVLDVQSNRLTSLKLAFSPAHVSLEELYLAHNKIGRDLEPADLHHLTSLSTIDLSHNAITSLDPFAPLTALEDLWLSYNSIPTLDSVASIARLPLGCVYLEHNPCASDDRYLSFLRTTFPTLLQVDAVCYPPQRR